MESKDKNKSKSSLTPIYIVLGIILAAIIASAVILPMRRGNTPTGGYCESSNQCKNGICYPYQSKSRCYETCKRGEHRCPLGSHCKTFEKHHRRTTRFINICVPD